MMILNPYCTKKTQKTPFPARDAAEMEFFTYQILSAHFFDDGAEGAGAA